jgi:hypothetical protein
MRLTDILPNANLLTWPTPGCEKVDKIKASNGTTNDKLLKGGGVKGLDGWRKGFRNEFNKFIMGMKANHLVIGPILCAMKCSPGITEGSRENKCYYFQKLL